MNGLGDVLGSPTELRCPTSCRWRRGNALGAAPFSPQIEMTLVLAGTEATTCPSL